MPISGLEIDAVPFWTWFLLLMRCIGMIEILPGIGTMQIAGTFRFAFAFGMSLCLVFGEARAEMPTSLAEGGLMIGAEFLLGFALGLIPAIVISGVSVAGQIITGAIGLGQANMIDPSLGISVAVLSRIQVGIATLLFLLIDGHHTVLRATSGIIGNLPIGRFVANNDIFMLLAQRFSDSFELAVMVSAPVLVTLLITNFVLGLITRFVPQVNIFIISLPLTIIVGLYIVVFTSGAFVDHLQTAFDQSEFSILRLVTIE
ncbi:MAG: flagellar biosynthetic protein FliR [Deltaproteobacteria bacterium]|nr:flagellar biosynthetic protein FliR [Deltaproteobacteria bacterium]